MPGKAAKVVITERQQEQLQRLSVSRSVDPRWTLRSKIILQAFNGRNNEQIAAELNVERHQVGIWRRRWQQSWDALTLLECTDPQRLSAAVKETLSDAPRSGCPGKFTAQQVALIIALACESPELSGRPITHWTAHELQNEIVNKRNIVESIAESQVAHFLREAALKPQRSKMWLNTTEKDPELFKAQVEAVCTTYLNAADDHKKTAHTRFQSMK